MNSSAFHTDVADGIATVTLLGPGKGNALGPGSFGECANVFGALDVDDAVRVVLLRGSAKVFSYGLDLMAVAQELGPLLTPSAKAAERTRLLEVIQQMQQGPHAIFRCKKPVVAAIHGWCIGGGLDIVAACDLRLCSRDARFSLREVRVGMVADIGSLQRLPHVIGEAATRELALTGKDIDAVRALSLGLVSEVCDDADSLFVRARAAAAEIAANPPLVVQGVKRVMNARLAAEIEEGLRAVAVWNSAFLGSEDLAEALLAFAEKREPHFQGR